VPSHAGEHGIGWAHGPQNAGTALQDAVPPSNTFDLYKRLVS
jgi:hypothetical protein